MTATTETVQHTPGPWIGSNTGSANQALVYSETTGNNIAVLYDRRDKAIIAAAPELLEAAKNALDSLRRLPNSDGAYQITCIQQLADAIAKAEGIW